MAVNGHMKLMTRCTGRLPFRLGLILLLILGAAAGCEGPSPIKLGLVGGMTGRHSDLGISGRSGVILAVEEINARGGINGRPVELITRDDRQDPETAVRVVGELVDLGVSAIIGPFTSAMSMATVSLVNEKRMVMVSPTTSSNLLTGIDDYFFRVMSPSRTAIDRLAEYVHAHRGIGRVAVVYDLSNAAFSKAWFDYIAGWFRERGAGEVIPVPFTSGPEVRFSDLALRIAEEKAEGVVLSTASLDAAMLCQQMRKKGVNAPVFSTMWAMTDDFIQHGGLAAEGVVFAHWFFREYRSDAAERFRTAFGERFGTAPNFASHFAYEAAQVLFKALARDDDPRKLKETIIQQGIFEGIQGEIRIDRYGDPQRKVFLMVVRDGRFHALE